MRLPLCGQAAPTIRPQAGRFATRGPQGFALCLLPFWVFYSAGHPTKAGAYESRARGRTLPTCKFESASRRHADVRQYKRLILAVCFAKSAATKKSGAAHARGPGLDLLTIGRLRPATLAMTGQAATASSAALTRAMSCSKLRLSAKSSSPARSTTIGMERPMRRVAPQLPSSSFTHFTGWPRRTP